MRISDLSSDVCSSDLAPDHLRGRFEELIANEASYGPDGRIVAKMHALSDAGMIDTLYEAARAGVGMEPMVRGICCLRPGLPGLSESVRARSILDRSLDLDRQIDGMGRSLPVRLNPGWR